MDIAAMSIAASQYKLQEIASIMIMKKAMSSARQDGDSLVRMIDQSAVESYDPNLGNNIDRYV
ncbi:MAG: hypothetical protein JL50_17320 [Peptococcaceae bacterium BICA1-7]|nr:MAG: hypothetical protein JL50_17320 [Peptococcaceae bacterium BICA1-7]HBV98690.1 putative motility protein [Desulfotomaculum sp.]